MKLIQYKIVENRMKGFEHFEWQQDDTVNVSYFLELHMVIFGISIPIYFNSSPYSDLSIKPFRTTYRFDNYHEIISLLYNFPDNWFKEWRNAYFNRNIYKTVSVYDSLDTLLKEYPEYCIFKT